MNAPETQIAVAPLFGIIPRTHIRLGIWNPRKRITEAELQELADSIRLHGLMQPILVRPIEGEDDMYELVFGERRFRAAEVAGLEGISCQVRTMTDKEVRIAQHIENLQRKDVHPIEEAEGYELLMREDGYTADQLAEETGKSRSYIYGRLKLCALAPSAREAFYDGKLAASTALLIARIPVESLQEHATEEILNNGDPLSYRAASEHIQERYMLNLDRARFSIKDAKLVKEVGSCEECPKRTGNQPMIYKDVGADVCTDPNCFASKSRAHDDKTLAAAKKKGIPVYEGEEAEEVFDKTDLVSADDPLHEFERRTAMQDYWTKVSERLTPEQLPKPAAYARIDGKVQPLFEKTAMQEALEKAGVCESIEQREAAEKSQESATSTTQKQAAAAPKVDIRVLAAEQECAARLKAYKRVRASADLANDANLLRPVLKALIGIYETYSDYTLPGAALADLYEFDTSSDAEIATYIDQAPADTLLLLLMDTIMGRAIEVGAYDMMADGSIDEDDGNYRAFFALTHAACVDLGQIRSELAPVPEEIDLGNRVRVNDDAKGPNGKKRKCCGKEGTVTVIDVTASNPLYTVEFGPKDTITNLSRNEITKVVAAEALSDEDEPAPKQGKSGKKASNPVDAWPFPTGAQP